MVDVSRRVRVQDLQLKASGVQCIYVISRFHVVGFISLHGLFQVQGNHGRLAATTYQDAGSLDLGTFMAFDGFGLKDWNLLLGTPL